jgi:hypothetical protein
VLEQLCVARGLEMSTGELADHLRDLCGEEVAEWLDPSSLADSDDARGGGTELYDVASSGPRGLRTAPTESGLAGRELTSLFGIARSSRGGGRLGRGSAAAELARERPPTNLFERPALVSGEMEHDWEDEPETTLAPRNLTAAAGGGPARMPTPSPSHMHAPRPVPQPKVEAMFEPEGAELGHIFAGIELDPEDLEEVHEEEPVAPRARENTALTRLHRGLQLPPGVGRQVLTFTLALMAAVGFGVAAGVGLTRQSVAPAPEAEPVAGLARTLAPPQPGGKAGIAHTATSKPSALLEVHEVHGTARPGQGGTIEVASNPRGARVVMDGRARCLTPCKMFDLPRKPVYAVKVIYPGRQAWTTLIDLAGRKTDRVTAELTAEAPGVGYLQVRSSRAAEIYLNGRSAYALANDGRLAVKPGHYAIMLLHPRSPLRPSSTLTVGVGETALLNLPFK